MTKIYCIGDLIMILFKSAPVELRGATAKQTKNGNHYALLNVENKDGKAFQMYVKDPSIITADFKKGDMIHMTCSYSTFDRAESVVVTAIEKVK